MTYPLLIAAPHSHAGKTTLTLALLRAYYEAGYAIQGAKSGPDYIDGRYHERACFKPCFNLDAWAMSPLHIRSLLQDNVTLIEGAMGLYDGAMTMTMTGQGSNADLANMLNAPVILLLDASKQSQSIAALAYGFVNFPNAPFIAGFILNNVGSVRHEMILKEALKPLQKPIFGALPRLAQIKRPSRHLGLVQADEDNLQGFFKEASDWVKNHLDLEALYKVALSQETPLKEESFTSYLAPPAQNIAIAQDNAFRFLYPHLLKSWKSLGANITFFSPLKNEAPPAADFIYLPGGYPELYAEQLSNNRIFLEGLKQAPQVYGECGGYIVMGDGLIDAHGKRHKMAGLLRLETSFEHRKRHLGYRKVMPYKGTTPWQYPLSMHEFHYCTTLKARGDALFQVRDAADNPFPDAGLKNGAFLGSFLHLIDVRPDWA